MLRLQEILKNDFIFDDFEVAAHQKSKDGTQKFLFKLSDGNLPGNIRYYHISLIDLTNNIQFYVTVYAKPTLNPSDLYLNHTLLVFDPLLFSRS